MRVQIHALQCCEDARFRLLGDGTLPFPLSSKSRPWHADPDHRESAIELLYWLKQSAIVEADFRPQILIDIDEAAETISITDNGPGIPVSDAEYVFRPFVSAKHAHEGSGLGLYIARELADYHDWSLKLVGKAGDKNWNTRRSLRSPTSCARAR